MRLSYRGLPYSYEPASPDMAEADMVGRYRGRSMHFSYPRHIPVPQPALDLKYRGIAYRTTTLGEVVPQVAQAAPVPKSAVPLVPSRLSKQVLMRELARVHRENLQHRLQHRIEVARARGDEKLLAQLENEMHQMA